LDGQRRFAITTSIQKTAGLFQLFEFIGNLEEDGKRRQACRPKLKANQKTAAILLRGQLIGGSAGCSALVAKERSPRSKLLKNSGNRKSHCSNLQESAKR